MADPILVKVSALNEMTDLATGDLMEIVDISEPEVANKTKKMQAGNIKIFNANQITDGILTTSKYADSSVTENKLGPGAVTSVKLGANSVIAGKIASKIITAAEIADNTVTTLNIKAQNVTSAEIKNATITATQLSANVAATLSRTVMKNLFSSDEPVSLKIFSNEFIVPSSLNGWTITKINGSLAAASSSGSVTCTVKVSSTLIGTATLGVGAYIGSDVEISTVVSTGSRMNFQVTGAGTGAMGLVIILILEKV
jgi:hypothetical protein